MSNERLRALVVLGFVFALGGITGVFIDRHHLVPTSAPAAIGLSGQELHNAAMSEMQAALQLDDDQMEKIHAILAANQDEVQKAWEVLRPEVQAAMQTVHGEIADLLRPEQRALYHEWLSKRQQQDDGETTIVLPRH